jgi:hypothetical protein
MRSSNDCSLFQATPLAIVSEVLLRYPHLDGSATKVLGAYDGFVAILPDSQQRKRLEDLKEEEAGDERDLSEGPPPQS